MEQQKRADYRAGIIAAVVANSVSEKGHFEPADFFPSLQEGTREMSEEETVAMLSELARAFEPQES